VATSTHARPARPFHPARVRRARPGLARRWASSIARGRHRARDGLRPSRARPEHRARRASGQRRVAHGVRAGKQRTNGTLASTERLVGCGARPAPTRHVQPLAHREPAMTGDFISAFVRTAGSGAGAMAITALIALLFGTVAARKGGVYDDLLRRSVEFAGALPVLVAIPLLGRLWPLTLTSAVVLGVHQGLCVACLFRNELERAAGEGFVLAA